MIKHHRELEDLSRHEFRIAARILAEEYEQEAIKKSSKTSAETGVQADQPRRVAGNSESAARGVFAESSLVYRDPALTALGMRRE